MGTLYHEKRYVCKIGKRGDKSDCAKKDCLNCRHWIQKDVYHDCMKCTGECGNSNCPSSKYFVD